LMTPSGRAARPTGRIRRRTGTSFSMCAREVAGQNETIRFIHQSRDGRGYGERSDREFEPQRRRPWQQPPSSWRQRQMSARRRKPAHEVTGRPKVMRPVWLYFRRHSSKQQHAGTMGERSRDLRLRLGRSHYEVVPDRFHRGCGSDTAVGKSDGCRSPATIFPVVVTNKDTGGSTTTSANERRFRVERYRHGYC